MCRERLTLYCTEWTTNLSSAAAIPLIPASCLYSEIPSLAFSSTYPYQIVVIVSKFTYSIRLVRVERGRYETSRTPIGHLINVSSKQLSPHERRPAMEWINLTHFLLGNLVIDSYTLEVKFKIKCCCLLSLLLSFSFSQVVQDLNKLVGYQLTTTMYVENRWPNASYIIIYDGVRKEVFNFRLQTERANSFDRPFFTKNECVIHYRSDSKQHGSMGMMKFNGTIKSIDIKKIARERVMFHSSRKFNSIKNGNFLYTVHDGLSLHERMFVAEINCMYYDYESNRILFFSAINEKGKSSCPVKRWFSRITAVQVFLIVYHCIVTAPTARCARLMCVTVRCKNDFMAAS